MRRRERNVPSPSAQALDEERDEESESELSRRVDVQTGEKGKPALGVGSDEPGGLRVDPEKELSGHA